MVTADMEQERETGSTFYSMMMNAQVRQELRGREGGREGGKRERGREGSGREGGRRFLQGMVTVDMEQERETGSAFYSMMLNAQVRELRGREGGREGSEGGRERGREGSGREGGCEGGRRFLQGMVTADMEQERETGSTFYSMMMNAQVRQELRGREGGREGGKRERGREGSGREGGRRFLQGMVTVDMEQERETGSAFYSMLK